MAYMLRATCAIFPGTLTPPKTDTPCASTAWNRLNVKSLSPPTGAPPTSLQTGCGQFVNVGAGTRAYSLVAIPSGGGGAEKGEDPQDPFFQLAHDRKLNKMQTRDP